MRAISLRFAAAIACLLPVIANAGSTHKVTEDTQACENWDDVELSIAAVKGRYGSPFAFGCGIAPEGREVELVRSDRGYSLVKFCTRDGCMDRWLQSRMTA